MLFKKGNRQGKWKLAYFIDARILSRNENKGNELDIRPCVCGFFLLGMRGTIGFKIKKQYLKIAIRYD